MCRAIVFVVPCICAGETKLINSLSGRKCINVPFCMLTAEWNMVEAKNNFRKTDQIK